MQRYTLLKDELTKSSQLILRGVTSTGNKIEIITIDNNTGNMISGNTIDQFTCHNTLNAPEMQISSNGLFLAMAKNSSSFGGGEIRFHEINGGYAPISRYTITEPLGGTISSLDFSPEGQYFYYISRSGGKTYMNRKHLVSAADEVIFSSSKLNPSIEIRRLKDCKIYIAGYNIRYLRVINNPDGNHTFTNKTVFPNTSYGLKSYLPIQKIVKAALLDSDYEDLYTRSLNNKIYEITDHLGNVRAVISDEKHATITSGVPGDFVPDMVAGNNYYPGGSIMPGRSFNSPEYRYSFNGKERDDEIKGSGNSLDFGARIYDPRLGRFLSVDPLSAKNVSVSAYHFASNSPIFFIDSKGEDAVGYIGKDGKLYINATYHAVSEGVDSYTDVEMRQIENTANNFYSQAKGMKVTLSDGREVEVGGINVKVVPGGDFSSTVNAAKSLGENVLFKKDGKYIKNRGGESTQAISTNDVGGKTINTTFLNSDEMSRPLFGEEADNFNNSIVDEAGHTMGTKHPARKEGESRRDYQKRRESNYGDLERGNKKATGELKLSNQDVQNIVTSKEFKLKEEK